MATTAELQAYAAAAAQKNGVPVNMFLWQIGKESAWNPNAKNPNSSASGIAQFVDGTAAAFSLDTSDPYASLDAAAKYDAQLFAKTGSWEKALTSYGTLSGADSSTKEAFNMALQKDGAQPGTEDMSLTDRIMSGIKNITGSTLSHLGLPGLAASALDETWNNGKVNEATQLTKWVGSGAFIVLGIIVIALAILSNKAVQQTAITAVKAAAK